MNRAEKKAALEDLARNRAVKGWAFEDLPESEVKEIRMFLEGGTCPAKHRSSYELAREQLKLGPKDWYEAYAEAVSSIGKSFPDILTDDEDKYCEDAADSVAERPKEQM
jgi:hypothetical protein